MLTRTNYNISQDIIQEAITQLPEIDFKLALNQPTGNFFYDPWEVKPEYKGTVWEIILDSLKEVKGEARLIALDPGKCYLTHADIDDRWHLSIQSTESFLVGIDNNHMVPLNVDGVWYDMDAGGLHSAVNFSNKVRVQLVVRKLLRKNTLKDPVDVRITLAKPRPDYRYIFDHLVSPWLNRANKFSVITDFDYNDKYVGMKVEKGRVNELTARLEDIFVLEVI